MVSVPKHMAPRTPTLFNTAIHIHKPVYGLMFAGDLLTYVPCADTFLGQAILQEALKKILKNKFFKKYAFIS